MGNFLATLLRNLGGTRGTDMRRLCRELLSQRGEVSQTVLAGRILAQYKSMEPGQQLAFFQMLASEFGPDSKAMQAALDAHQRAATPATAAALFSAFEPPRQELFRRLNTGMAGTESLVKWRAHLLRLLRMHPELAVVDADLKHLFRSWFNRGFLRMERIGWDTPAITLEKLIAYESVHEINGWPELRRRLESDRRCFAFFHPAVSEGPVIFVQVAITRGLAQKLEPLVDITAPVLPADQGDTATFYSINNCLDGLRGIPFGLFLIKQVVEELQSQLPRIRCYSTLSPVPLLSRALQSDMASDGFTRERLGRLLHEFHKGLTQAAHQADVVDAFFSLLQNPADHDQELSAPLRRVTLAYLTHCRSEDRPYDPVASFHFSNGARLEAVNPFANLRPYGLRDSFGVMVNYRYVPNELEENHERFVRTGELRVANGLLHEYRIVTRLWSGETGKSRKRSHSAAKHVGEGIKTAAVQMHKISPPS
jgi:malonyl-CoA decarboxylase